LQSAVKKKEKKESLCGCWFFSSFSLSLSFSFFFAVWIGKKSDLEIDSTDRILSGEACD